MRMPAKIRVVAASLVLTAMLSVECRGESHTIKTNAAVYIVEPASMQVLAESEGSSFTISERQGAFAVSDQVSTPGGISWRLPERSCRIFVAAKEDSLEVTVRAEEAGTAVAFPVQSLSASRIKGLIWPRREGCYIPLDDPIWRYELTGPSWNTLEHASMPFWGIDAGGRILSCLSSTQFHNEVRFEEVHSDGVRLTFTHTFVKGEPEEIRFRFRAAEQSSPLMPALDYRKWLIEKGSFVSLAEKARRRPAVSLLPGAPHVYLWGGGVLTRFDLPRGAGRRLAKRLVDSAAASASSPGKHLRQFFSDEDWKAVGELAGSEYDLAYAQSVLCEKLSAALKRADFYHAEAWQSVSLSSGTRTLLSQSGAEFPADQQTLLNCMLLHDAFSDALPPVGSWGGAYSPGMLKAFRSAGLERLRLCLDAWNLDGHADFAKEAIRAGYLIGPYDSYHSIHDPKTSGTDLSWPTAQFDRHLFETGPIVQEDGTKRKGFKQTGYLLSPHAARPYVEKRVKANYDLAPFNYYFFDCDGFGQLFDDYSPLHPSTQLSDGVARNGRMEWVGNTFGAAIGTEGGSAYAADSCELFEGISGDLFGWGDKDMSDKKSPYYTGAYYPPEAPAVFFKPVPAKEKYLHVHFDPRFRLPLFEAVYHDAVVSGRHWNAASLKYSNAQTTVALTEMLYQVPPLYHLNPQEFAKRKGDIVKHYEFFSPLHRITAWLPLTEFEWLDESRLVQRTRFGNDVEVVANFSAHSYRHGNTDIPGASVAAFRNGQKANLFRP